MLLIFLILLILFCLGLIFLIKSKKSKNNFNKSYEKLNISEILDNIIETDFKVFVKKQIDIINQTNSLDVINRRFNNIILKIKEQEVKGILLIDINHHFKEINIASIDGVSDLKFKFLKWFVFKRVDLEITKLKYINSLVIKEKQLNKGINLLLKAIEFLPDDEDIHHRIIELEDQLKTIY